MDAISQKNPGGRTKQVCLHYPGRVEERAPLIVSHHNRCFLPCYIKIWIPLVTSLKRWRAEVVSPGEKELNRVVAEQALLIDSLKEDKSQLEESLKSLRSDHERISKENQILRRAVSIQQERQNHAENELKAAHQYREDAEDKMKKLEQIIVSLRYHLQTQQCSSMGNDFLHHRPPDVF